MTNEQRVWCAMLYAADICDMAGAVRRSERLHRKQADARREIEGWVTEMKRDPVRWEIVDDEIFVGRIFGYFAVLSSFLLPNESEVRRP